jgi:hypothetical protein
MLYAVTQVTACPKAQDARIQYCLPVAVLPSPHLKRVFLDENMVKYLIPTMTKNSTILLNFITWSKRNLCVQLFLGRPLVLISTKVPRHESSYFNKSWKINGSAVVRSTRGGPPSTRKWWVSNGDLRPIPVHLGHTRVTVGQASLYPWTLNSSQFCSRSLFPLLSILPLHSSSQIITCKIVIFLGQ